MRDDQSFAARIESRNGVTRVALTGELDMATAPALKVHLMDLERGGARVIMVDIGNLDFIDSYGLAALLQARRRSELNGHRFLTMGATATSRRLFEITGTEFLLDERDAADVVARFTRGQREPIQTQAVGAGSDD